MLPDNVRDKKRKQFLVSRRMLLEAESSKKIKILLKKFGIDDNKDDDATLIILSGVIFSMVSYINETEELLGRRTQDWLLEESTDLQQYISLIAKDKYLGNGSDIRHAKKLAVDSIKLLKKIVKAKNGT